MGRKPNHQPESIELIVLSVLCDEKMYGYQIIREVASRSDGTIRLSPGVLYPALHEMERCGLITASWEEVRSERRSDDDETPGRRRKWYRLSAKGQRRLRQRITAHRAYHAMIEAFIPELGGDEKGA